MKTENRATKFFYTIIEMLCTLMLVTLSPGTFLCKLFFLSIESRVHMCVRRIFFVEQLNIGKTEGGGLIWSKLTLFRHPIILEETVIFFCAKRHIFTKPFFFISTLKLQSTVGKLLALHCYKHLFEERRVWNKNKNSWKWISRVFFNNLLLNWSIYWEVTQTML